MADAKVPFWELKTLAEMSVGEWESLCDGCAKCCLHKLQDEETDEIFYTSVACEKLDLDTCRCSVYEQRLHYVPDCLDLTQGNLDELSWLPSSCAYRIVAEGRRLPDWHHLVSGDFKSIHKAGMSVVGRVVSETEVPAQELELYIIDEFKTEN
ncbi:hypothetical protein A3742_16055 [Oleiphilus sp. HI0071]|jgi:uncharacterized cysteine cluster protein YcgN (CxxCxxCC family)|uniref:YcgN family cysteine cluster protein n=1 Tax=unclassified Oleiphilus TaxID=2631174 RepID=UPI0007C252A5|nr:MULTISPECIES: YcgN family cysteine cluster protein [unclassified Oleiphilus]KZY62579.1 hypothetical protein A3737_14830 [Oleiphilus sp. HI0065]KZY87515.1 hypothetical protein A3742_16055 [Oleiphilus sp. HI0071]KZY92066.1 hypothetical protein A3744_19930 [Oleiphilus sp. HI0073]KZZ45006.1 hypothetical protein A3758_03445 [Oleiphilus sp. HI0118]KZZ47893.1 hypothetical protein A3760_24430 [Oleiphilus sp. HI0122]KZZ66117.1 hypothetical protein A3765_19765 [Oleiphilus sp. HI0130]KZZ76240.1 hypo